MKKPMCLFWAISLTLSLVCSASAATTNEISEAAAYLKEQKILTGNEYGDLMLDKYLSRAELAAILTRIIGNPEHVEADRKFYASQCKFMDVPDWARHYVGYCASNHFLLGYGNGVYGAADPVTPAAACTVILRYLEEYENVEWTYETACEKAIEEGIASATALTGDKINRGNMAVLLHRSILKHPGSGTEATVPDAAVDPQEVDRYIPKVGDVIRCDDGYNYKVTNVERWDANAFADGPLPPLPAPTCDWSLLPHPELPDKEARHFSNGDQEILFLRNLYETRRMQYTLYNAIGSNPETWRDGKPVKRSDGSPLVDLHLYVPNEENIPATWPWRADLFTEYFKSCPVGDFHMEAWDVFVNGEFQRTEYYYTNI